MAMVWGAILLCACMSLLVCVLCQPVHSLNHPARFLLRNLFMEIIIVPSGTDSKTCHTKINYCKLSSKKECVYNYMYTVKTGVSVNPFKMTPLEVSN